MSDKLVASLQLDLERKRIFATVGCFRLDLERKRILEASPSSDWAKNSI